MKQHVYLDCLNPFLLQVVTNKNFNGKEDGKQQRS